MRENMGMYRGKRLDNAKWIFGNLVCSNRVKTGERIYEIWAPLPEGETNPNKVDYGEVLPNTVGECTGLTDKNGKRIFEGDVISGLFLYALPINGVCVFRNGSFGLEWERGKAKEFTPFTSMCNVHYEVIGNIHDNTELKGAVNDN